MAPQDVLKTHGADILRLWVASCEYGEDVRLSPQILEQTAELYRKIRNTMRYLLGSLSDFHPERDRVPTASLLPVDRWAVARAAGVMAEAAAAYDRYEFHRVTRAVAQWCIVDLSNFYLDVLKDRLYTLPPGSPLRRSAQTGLYATLDALVTLLAPILPFTTEEVWAAWGRTAERPSVHLADWPSTAAAPLDAAADGPWPAFFSHVRPAVLKALEATRATGAIGDPSEGDLHVVIHDADVWAALQPLVPTLGELLQVSAIAVTHGPGDGVVTAQVSRAPGRKCRRCWRYTHDVGRSREHPDLCVRCIDTLAVNEKVSS